MNRQIGKFIYHAIEIPPFENAKNILDSICGQLSDGKWENSKMAEHFWPFIETDELFHGHVQLLIDVAIGRWNQYHSCENGFYGMSDENVKIWFAKKLKAIVKDYEKYEGKKIWKRDCEDVFHGWFHGNVKVSETYKMYDYLMGRIDENGNKVVKTK